MNKSPKISFIPKKPFSGVARRSSIGLLSSISLILFFGSLFLTSGLYFYENIISKSVNEKTKELDVERKKADPTDSIEKASKLEARIGASKKLLSRHVAVSRVLNLIEEKTLSSITFDNFTLGVQNTTFDFRQNVTTGVTKNNNDFDINITGRAPSYSSLAYQSDVLKKEIESGGRIKSFLISELNLDERGNVIFDLDIVIHQSFLLYSETVSIPDTFTLDEENIVKEEAENSEDVDVTQSNGRELTKEEDLRTGEYTE